jgi:serine/threonine-protein kinase
MLAAFVVVALIGAWSYVQVRSSLRDLRAAGLASLLEAEARGLQLWIDERKRDAELWAALQPVRDAGARLAAHGDSAKACADAAQKVLREQVAPYAGLEEAAAFNLVARDGRIIAALDPRNCGLLLSAPFMRLVAPVFEGKTVFVAPWREQDRVGASGSRAPGDALTWAEAPVRAEDGSVVAALGFGRPAAQRFAELLVLSAAATTRDAYAFDESGNLLTRSRFASSLGPGPHAARVEGGDLTALAGAALAADAPSQGVILEPYRNYRGAHVIGAWRRLPESRMVVAVEIDAAEAYQPLDTLPLAFGVLLTLVLVSMTAAASTSLWAVRVRMREAKRVGQYQLGRQIGEGGMSHVYVARHTLLKRPAAVKVLKSHLATDEVVTRFQREAQLCSQLSHPNTIEIYDYGSTRDGRWYYAMEYLRGLPLETLVRRDGPCPAGAWCTCCGRHAARSRKRTTAAGCTGT